MNHKVYLAGAPKNDVCNASQIMQNFYYDPLKKCTLTEIQQQILGKIPTHNLSAILQRNSHKSIQSSSEVVQKYKIKSKVSSQRS